ncbi:MAG: hypothetical protein JRI76_10315 [Deltaproteobacteria bacterium]|nr:hypothetical protein [Deltaproteobacteria bacterium]MBW2042409.1 hypothetical protein [Deltaproteobacteria bacterium]MBW2131052.1 hypothetical protein [Deltaproteobacteria bacterium]
MIDTLERLKKRLQEVETKIRETEARLPAHSMKPPIMHELFDLEDERDRLLEALGKEKKADPNAS